MKEQAFISELSYINELREQVSIETGIVVYMTFKDNKIVLNLGIKGRDTVMDNLSEVEGYMYGLLHMAAELS